MLILGVETSCDETALAVVEDGRRIRSNVVSSQVNLHARYGGVVPEVASRRHIEAIVPALDEALERAGAGLQDLDAVSVTYGPGLAGALLVGVNFAKALAYAAGLPLVPVNHLEGHIYAAWLEPGTAQGGQAAGEPFPDDFPMLALVVSGGHSDVVLMEGHGRYTRLGQTVDDAAGEAFDKVARLLGLGFPGGPAIDRLAREAPRPSFQLPRARLDAPYDFSFSGLKTKVQRIVRGEEGPVPGAAELAAAFQESVVDSLVTRAVKAAEDYGVRRIILSGGVAANSLLRATLAQRAPVPVAAPPPVLCTDNGAMIAACAYWRLQTGDVAPLSLDIDPALRIG
jgi:N6-L-threonylcarbamoyladenine synthase